MMEGEDIELHAPGDVPRFRTSDGLASRIPFSRIFGYGCPFVLALFILIILLMTRDRTINEITGDEPSADFYSGRLDHMELC